MTKYHGGKQKIGKELAKVIYDESEDFDFKIKGYCEPFCGMLGVYTHIPSLFGDIKYKAGDMNPSVIKMWKAIKRGWNPPKKVTRKEYESLKKTLKTPSALKGFVGHQFSYGGQYFMNYSNTSAKGAIKRIDKLRPILKNIIFSHGLYTQFSNLKNYVIYCDPPYQNTQSKYLRFAAPSALSSKKDKRLNVFDSDKFWKWCKKMAKNNIVFISSYSAPKDFEQVFSKKVKINLNSPNMKNKNISRTEKLFIIY